MVSLNFSNDIKEVENSCKVSEMLYRKIIILLKTQVWIPLTLRERKLLILTVVLILFIGENN